MKNYAISQIRQAVKKMIRKPSKSLVFITEAVEGDATADETLSTLALLRRRLISKIDSTRSPITFPALIAEAVALTKIQNLERMVECFYCTAEEAQVLGRIILWEARVFINCVVADLAVPFEQKQEIYAIGEAFGLIE